MENHGIHVCVLEDMLIGVRSFYEQDAKVKKQFYTRDMTRKVVYNSSYTCIVRQRLVGYFHLLYGSQSSQARGIASCLQVGTTLQAIWFLSISSIFSWLLRVVSSFCAFLDIFLFCCFKVCMTLIPSATSNCKRSHISSHELWDFYLNSSI